MIILRVFYFFELLLFFLKELMVANLQVALLVFKGPKKLSPGIIKVPFDLKSEIAQVTLANMITLTPGTLSIDIFPDSDHSGPYILVHVVHFEDAESVRKSINDGFTRRIKRVFG